MNGNIYQHYQGYELLIRKLEEGINRYEENYIPSVYGFLGLDGIKTAESYLGNRVPHEFLGGYQEAFSKRLVIGDDIVAEDYICCLHCHFNRQFNHFTHRDVMGALYNLGVDNQHFGDLWVDEDDIYIYTTVEMSQFVMDNLTKIGHGSVRFTRMDSFPAQQFRYNTRKAVISSYRLDKVIAAVIKKSRQKAQGLIRGGQVNVNFQTIEDCDHLCNNGDILSVSGVGRFKIGEEIADTKSGNVIVELKQFV